MSIIHAYIWKKGDLNQELGNQSDNHKKCLPIDWKFRYKASPKRVVNAPAWRRSSQPPPPQRWQQIGSSSSLLGGVKRETSEKVS